MKRFVSLLLVLTFVCLAAVACGKNSHYNYDLKNYIDLAEYMNLPAKTIKSEVTDEDVEDQIMSAINYYSRKVQVTDRPVQKGDIVTVDYMGYVGEVNDSVITVTDTDVCVGLGDMPEEFENALIGLNIGDQTYAQVMLPVPFEESPEYAGKLAELVILVKAINVNEAPIYNDDFVRAYLGHNSVEEYEQAVRDALVAKQKQAYYDIVIPQIWNDLTDATEVKKYPDSEVKYYYDSLVNSVKSYVDALGLDMEAFIKTTFEMSEDEFYEKSLEEAQITVKEQMMCSAIAKAEGIKVSAAEYNTRALRYAQDNYDFTSVEELEEKFSHDEIELLILCDMVKEYLADHASITYTNED